MILVLKKCFRLVFFVVLLRRDGLMNVVVDDGTANMLTC